MKRKLSLQAYLASRVLPFVALFIAIVAYLAVQHTRDIAEQQVIEEHSSFIISYREHLEAQLKSLVHQTTSIANNAIVVNGIVDVEDRESYIPLFIESLAIAGIENSHILYTDYAARPISRNFSAPVDTYFDTNAWKAKVLEKGEVYSELTLSGLTIVAPVYFANNPEGSIGVHLPLSELNDLLKIEGLAIHSFLVDQQDRLLLTTNENLASLGQSLNVTGDEWYVLKQEVSLPVGDKLSLISVENISSAMKLSRDLEASLVITVGIFLLGVVVSIVVIARNSGNTIAALSTAIADIKESGELSNRVAEGGPKEMAELGCQFNDLLTQLQSSTFSKQRVSAIFDSMKELLLVTDFNGRLIQSNKTAEEFAREHAIELQKNVFAILGFDRDDGMFDGREASIEKVSELTLPLTGGFIRQNVIIWRRSLLKSSTGVEIGYIFIGSDITSMVQAEKNLRVRNKAIEAAKNGITIADASLPDLPLIYVNEAFEKLSGYSKDEVIGINCRFLQGPDHNQPAVKELRDAIDQKKACSTILKNYRKDGKSFWCELNITPITDDAGNLTHYLGIQTDVTERVEHDEQLKDAILKAETANKAKDDFLSTMSHEIRTPMNGVLGMAEMLSQTELDLKQKEFVGTIVDSSRSLINIINDILDFSKIESGNLELENIEFDLEKCAHDVLSLFSDRAQEKLLHILLDMEPSVPNLISGDSGRLRQILVNLVGNALKFTDSGHVKLSIRLNESHNSCIRFEVQDTGIGISPTVQPHLFSPFTQADSSTTRIFGGTGLGLSICKRLVEAMGGSIGLDSEEGKGSIFWFTLPCDRTNTDSGLIAPKSMDQVLVLEGYGESTQLLERSLSSLEMNSQLVKKQELLDTVDSPSFNSALLILDLQDNEADIEPLLSKLTASTKDIRLLVLSNPFDNRSKFGLNEFQKVWFINKPWSPRKLFASLTAAINNTGAEETNVLKSDPGGTHRLSGIYSSKNILVVDDTLVNQKVVESMLATINVKVDIAGNGLEALESVKSKDYDLIFMDCLMPEMDGYDATRAIRKMGKHLPIVALTANAMNSSKEKCFDAGMDDFITKPVEMSALFDMLEKHLNARSTDLQMGPLEEKQEPITKPFAVLDNLVIESLGPAVKNIFTDVVNTGLADIEKQISEFKSQLNEPIQKDVIRYAHSIKSCSMQVGSKELSVFAKEKEKQYIAGDFSDLEGDFKAFQEKYLRLKVALNKFLETQRIA